MGIFAWKLGKKLEKSIKSVFPYWLFGLQDTYREVAVTAGMGIDKTLSEDKQIRAMGLCLDEIISV